MEWTQPCCYPGSHTLLFKAMGLSPWQPARLTSVQPFLPSALLEHHCWSSVCCRSRRTGEQTALAAHCTNQLNGPSPKGTDALGRIRQEFGITESLFQTNLLCYLRGEMRVGGHLIQKEVMVCSVQFSFPRGINLFVHHDCLGSPAYSRVSQAQEFTFTLLTLFSAVAAPVGPQSDAPTCRDTAFPPWGGNCSLASLCYCMQTPCPELVGPASPCLQWSGFLRAGIPVANYPVWTRVRPAGALAVHTDAFLASCAG